MITIDYIKANQQEHQHIDVMKDMFLYLDDLNDTNDYKTNDNFIEEFCKADICFQYHVCLLTAIKFSIRDLLNNVDMLKESAKKTGIKEFGEEDTLRTLYGLL